MKTYIMVGAGGTGTHLIGALLPYLRTHHREEEWQLVVVDGDNFDAGNTTRQLFDPGMVSENKAEAMKQMYNAYPVVAVPRFIGKTDLDQMMQDGDTVLICADNHSIRALIQDRALELNECVVINAGNEEHDGNVQLWVRQDGKNVTPKLTYGHPEIVFKSEEDRAAMTCQQAAALPGGGQLILANQQAAGLMLQALWRFHQGHYKKTGRGEGWTEMQFDVLTGVMNPIDMRERRNWAE